jgi:hypothetical protein
MDRYGQKGGGQIRFKTISIKTMLYHLETTIVVFIETLLKHYLSMSYLSICPLYVYYIIYIDMLLICIYIVFLT